MKCYYHSDLDGRCAGAIVYKKHPRGTFIEINYNDKVDIGSIGINEKIIIVDFSFKPEVMEKVFGRTTNIIWLDHHKTAIEYEYSQKIPGIRNIKYSGCEIAWVYFFNEQPMPLFVKLVGDYDTWKHKLKGSTDFHEGMRTFPNEPKDDIWKTLLENHDDTLYLDICEIGSNCIRYREKLCKDYIKSFGFEMNFEGYKCFVVGLYMFGSKTFGDKINQYDFCMAFEFTGQDWIVGLYSTKIDVSEIAKKYGGGGHTGAAGFVSDLPPWDM